MKVSVIIPTYNGKHKIGNLLDSLKNQTFTDFELLVSIDGSTDGTFEYLQSRKSEFSDLVIINESNGGRSVCRNRAANLASGDLLVFLDDDMRVVSKFIEMHISSHLLYHNSIIVGSQIEDFDWCTSEIQKFKGYLARAWVRDIEGKLNYPYITAANFSISKQLFFNLGAFDENLTDAEDYDLAISAIEANVDIYLFKDLIGWHDDSITCKSYIKRLREYDKAQEKLRKLKPERYSVKYNLRTKITLSFLKRTIYKIFSNKNWVNLIENNKLLFLPKFIRYRIYDYVITGLGVHNVERKI